MLVFSLLKSSLDWVSVALQQGADLQRRYSVQSLFARARQRTSKAG
jgi:hypothetical protein